MKRKVQVWILRRSPKKKTAWEVLLLKRRKDRHGYKGEEQPMTGSVDPGESSIAAARRELHEETGFNFSQNRIRPMRLLFRFIGRHGETSERVYAVVLKPHEAQHKIRLDRDEHRDWRWVSPKIAQSQVLHDRQREALKKCLRAAEKF